MKDSLFLLEALPTVRSHSLFAFAPSTFVTLCEHDTLFPSSFVYRALGALLEKLQRFLFSVDVMKFSIAAWAAAGLVSAAYAQTRSECTTYITRTRTIDITSTSTALVTSTKTVEEQSTVTVC